jgi:uncharacterized protein
MFLVPLREFVDGPVVTDGRLPPTDEHLADVDFTLAEPVDVQGRLMETGPGRYYWDAQLGTRVLGSCRRCLAPVTARVAPRVKVLLVEGEDPDDPDAYVVPVRATELDLGDVIREELILAVPDFLVCRDDCRGLCAQCGADLNQGPCDCRPEPDARWAALEALKAARPDDPTE